ncbi:MAG TPA: hypothetical protein PKA37_12120 [Planctomycetota bacterium]|jgi:hypothetical protein|nr:hypothetical protein [Planctomycetota bacterium]
MVNGLELFRDHFRRFQDCYVLIGGTACHLLFDEVGREFRSTKDLDIVLCIETLTPEFSKKFWEFVIGGGYQPHQDSADRPKLYRFSKPNDPSYPFMLELFCKGPDALGGVPGSITPIQFDDDVSSLSAILMDDDYYALVLSNKVVVDGLTVLRV